MGRILHWKKENWKQYHLPYNIEAVEKNIKWGRGERDGVFEEENQNFKKYGGAVGKNIRLQGTFYTTAVLTSAYSAGSSRTHTHTIKQGRIVHSIERYGKFEASKKKNYI